MATFDKKVLASLRNKATVLGFVLIGLVSCNKDNKATENAQDAYVIHVVDSLVNSNRDLRAQLDSCKQADQDRIAREKAKREKAARAKAAREKAAREQAAPKTVITKPINLNDSAKFVYEASEEKKSTFKIVAGDSVQIGTLRAHGNADGEVEIQIVGGAKIDTLDMADYRTKMPAPVVVQQSNANANANSNAGANQNAAAASEANANYKRKIKLVVDKTVIVRQH